MSTRRDILGWAVATAMLPLTAPKAVWAASWVNLGSRKVRAYGDADRFSVADNGGLYTRLRVAVTGNNVFIEGASVLFGNGETVLYKFDTLLGQGTISRSVDLPGGARSIIHVDMFYRRSRNGNGGAVVTLQGLTA